MTPGTGTIVAEGTDVAIVSLGPVLRSALEARKTLAADGVSACVVDLRFAQPLDAGLLKRVAGMCRTVLLAEETTRSTGIYDSVLEVLVRSGLDISRIGRCGVGDAFPVQDKRVHLLSTYQLDAAGLAQAVHALLTGANTR